MQQFEKLEQELAAWIGLGGPEHVVCCSSGTAALHLALEAFELPKESQVICPTFTMIACARAITLAGFEPVFVDCSERKGQQLNISTYLIYDVASGELPTAIMAVHIYGRLCDMKLVHREADWLNTRVIEDMAEAHGIQPHPSTDAACWSFYKNKVVHGEEGGAVYFKNPHHAKFARMLRSLGFTDQHDFMHVPRGHNYRMSNLHAEPIRNSLLNSGNALYKRRMVEEYYDKIFPKEWQLPKRDSVWVYDLRIPGLRDKQRYDIVSALNAIGIAARHSFQPMHVQPEYKLCRKIGGNVAELAAREVFYIPVNPDQEKRGPEIKSVIESVLSAP